MYFICLMVRIVGAGSEDANGDLCFLLVFLVMAFLCFNFGMITSKVSADGTAATLTIDVDGVGSWLPSTLLQRLAAAAGLGPGVGLSTSLTASSSCGC